MNVVVKRFEFGPNYTVGKLWIDGAEQCYTLERETVSVTDGRKPAIPEGQYHTTINFSQHFQRDLPELLDVPGYEGIRIHPGNSDKDTEGCILLGRDWVGGDWISNSKVAFDAVFQKMLNYKQDFVVTVTSDN